MSLVYGSLFSGCAGMDRGFDQAGFAPAWHSEVDKDAVSVLRRHYRDVPQLGDVTKIHGGYVQPVDVMQGGSPCQDVSQAGTRAGIDGSRSGLFFDYVRIVRQMREATNGRYPAVVVLENVDGLLSSNRGRDFAVVLGRLQELGAAVAYRVLDAQFFGVPQRRRRVFLVADFAPIGVGEERAAQILALRESLCGHSAPGNEAGQGLAGAAEDGAGVGGNVFSESGPGWWNDGYGCLRAEGENRPSRPSHVVLEPLAFGGNNCSTPIDVSTCLSTRDQRLDFETQTFIVAPEFASTIQASAGHHGHSSPRGDGSDNLVALAFDARNGTDLGDTASSLQAGNGNGRGWSLNCAPLVAERQALGFHLTQHPIVSEDAMPAIGAGNTKGTSSLGVFERYGLKWIVRRLTPKEGERLQGYPDDWTRWRHDGQQISDSARWRLIGNGVATPVAYWIAQRLRAALEAS